MPTDKKFTGQRLDGTGLYYYGARYYDPAIGRFISPDTIIPDPANPQSLNRYSYVLNNPLRYMDPTGQEWVEVDGFPFWIDDYDPVLEDFWILEEVETWRDDPLANTLLDTDDNDFLGLENPDDLVKAGIAGTAALLADDVTGFGVVNDIAIVAIWGGIGYVIIRQWAEDTFFSTNEQDKPLTKGEIETLEDHGYPAHEVKKGYPHSDLYKKPNGDVVIKPKGGKGLGEPTGININDFK